MATHPIAHITREPGNDRVPAWRRRLGRVLPLLITLAALFSMPGVAFASGTPVSLAVDPASGPVGTQVTVKGSNFPSGHQIQIGYAV
ncbi:MAG TPA: IPT/TIG domain-containing protein, partial [Ktedonobacterales bacterium]